jgi:hypothetical protein
MKSHLKNKSLCLLAAGLDAVNPLFLLCLQVTELVEEDESWADMEFILDNFIPPGSQNLDGKAYMLDCDKNLTAKPIFGSFILRAGVPPTYHSTHHSGPSGSLQDQGTFSVDDAKHTATMSPDSDLDDYGQIYNLDQVLARRSNLNHNARLYMISKSDEILYLRDASPHCRSRKFKDLYDPGLVIQRVFTLQTSVSQKSSHHTQVVF